MEMTATDPLNPMAHVFWVTVEGIIGAGKSELMKILVPRLKEQFGADMVIEVPEDVDALLATGLFQRYQNDPARFSFQFQAMFFHTRTATFLREWDALCKRFKRPYFGSNANVAGSPHPNVVIISERSILTDSVFMDVQKTLGTATEEEWADYRRLNSMWTRLYPVQPRAIIYCRPGGNDGDIIDEADRRVKERSREAEENLVTKAYNGTVHAAHEEAFGGDLYRYKIGEKRIHEIPIIHFDSTPNYRDDEEIALKSSGSVIGRLCQLIEGAPFRVLTTMHASPAPFAGEVK